MQSFFSTQVYFEKVRPVTHSWSLSDLKKETRQIQNTDLPGQMWSKQNYKNGFTSYGSNESGYDRLQRVSSTFSGLEKSVDQHVAKFIKALEFDIKPRDLIMTHCWVNVMGKNANHLCHAHPLSVISGTFYLEAPKSVSPLKLEDPRMPLFMNSPGIKTRAKSSNKRHVEIQPKSGYVVLFESWLKHEVPANLSQKERLSISFNYGWK
ncbi:MAG: hypothetical protein H7Z71_06765 [Moraxellaceae bacterium]|nr:hypothetical protein [Pseudobdellovibrionaceae bacterium]